MLQPFSVPYFHLHLLTQQILVHLRKSDVIGRGNDTEKLGRNNEQRKEKKEEAI